MNAPDLPGTGSIIKSPIFVSTFLLWQVSKAPVGTDAFLLEKIVAGSACVKALPVRVAGSFIKTGFGSYAYYKNCKRILYLQLKKF